LTAHGWLYSWQWNDSGFGFMLSTWGQTKHHVTILFKKIKDFLVIRTLNNNLFYVFTGLDHRFARKKNYELYRGGRLDRSILI